MKYKYFYIRLLSFLLIVGLLAGYQLNIYLRSQAKEIYELRAQVDQLTRERDEFLEYYSDNVAKDDNAVKNDDATKDNQAEGLYMDGVYEGSGEGYGGPINVSVSIQQQKITAIEILSAKGEDQAYLSMGKGIIDTIIDRQTAEVDSVSGATFSSTGLRDAVADALKKAKKKDGK